MRIRRAAVSTPPLSESSPHSARTVSLRVHAHQWMSGCHPSADGGRDDSPPSSEGVTLREGVALRPLLDMTKGELRFRMTLIRDRRSHSNFNATLSQFLFMAAHEPRRALRLSLLLLALVPRLSRSWQCASRSALPRLALPRRSILSPSLLRPRASHSPALLAKKGKKGGGGKKGGKGKAKSGFEWASSFELKPFESAELRSLAETLVSTYQV